MPKGKGSTYRKWKDFAPDPTKLGKPLDDVDRRIMELISRGYYLEDIAETVGFSRMSTMRPRLMNICSKYGVTNLNAAVYEWAKEHREKQRLPDVRNSITHKVTIYDERGDAKVYITAGMYDDNRIGEVFLNIGLQGSTLRGVFDSWARMVSVSLQWGVPITDIIEKFKDASFPPSGPTDDKSIPQCTSIVDYAVRWLERVNKHGQRV